jgi:hypothetical protein
LYIARSHPENLVPRYCPAGDGVFEDWVDSCPECGRPLQDDPPAPLDETGGDEIAWLVTAPNEPEAQMWAETIRAVGIPVFVRAGGPGVGAWASVSSFEHELLVHARHLVEARRIVRELLNAPPLGTSRARRSAPLVNPVRKGDPSA